MGEVDDAQHAEDQRQADAHQRVDAADQDAGEDELDERAHGCVQPSGRASAIAAARGAQRLLQVGSGTIAGVLASPSSGG